MAGTKEGAIKAARTNLEKHGADFYSRIGRKGGRNGHRGGFASELRGSDGLTGRERARTAGAKGGHLSRRGPARKIMLDEPGERKEIIVVQCNPTAVPASVNVHAGAR